MPTALSLSTCVLCEQPPPSEYPVHVTILLPGGDDREMVSCPQHAAASVDLALSAVLREVTQ